MPSFIVDRRDLSFDLYELLEIQKLTSLDRYRDMSRDDWDAVLDAAEELARDVLWPTNAVADREGCKLENGRVKVPKAFHEVFEKYSEGGWIAVTRPTEYGGMGLPLPLGIVVTELMLASSPSFLFVPGLGVAGGHLLENFASDAIKKTVIPRLYSGEWAGTMCLTEPQAGTAVGDIKTTATPIPGTDEYAIRGNKIFISAGDHDLTENICHLVLARVPGDPAGTKGISLFLVPARRFEPATGALGATNDVTVTAIEHKMGIHGSPTCALSFGDNGECRGRLIGERTQGIVYMFQMMNEARIVCGIQGAGIANISYQLALSYARQRVQGAKVTDRSPDAKPVAIIEHPDVRRNLMLAKATSEGIRALLLQAGLYAELSHNHPDEAERAKNQDLVDLMTPICKAFATDQGFRVTELAIQIHGGYGYIKEYAVEQMMRDVKIASLYEGTNGVQALDLLGRKLRMRDGALLVTWMGMVNEWVEQNRAHPKLAAEVEAVDAAKNAVAEVAMHFATAGRADPEATLLSATPFLEMFGYAEVARLLVTSALIADKALAKASGEDARFYDAKIKTAKFYVHHVLPHAAALAQSIKSGDRSALDVQL
jgi:alkylation response protein AidB-like acyl-CoA dehydrogenase